MTTGSAAIAVTAAASMALPTIWVTRPPMPKIAKLKRPAARPGGLGLGVERTAGRCGQRQAGGQCHGRADGEEHVLVECADGREHDASDPGDHADSQRHDHHPLLAESVVEPARSDVAGDVADAERGEEQPVFHPVEAEDRHGDVRPEGGEAEIVGHDEAGGERAGDETAGAEQPAHAAEKRRRRSPACAQPAMRGTRCAQTARRRLPAASDTQKIAGHPNSALIAAPASGASMMAIAMPALRMPIRRARPAPDVSPVTIASARTRQAAPPKPCRKRPRPRRRMRRGEARDGAAGDERAECEEEHCPAVAVRRPAARRRAARAPRRQGRR